MNEDNVIQTIELSIQDAKKNIALNAALKKLHDDPNFKKVILDGYFRDEAIRLVGIKAQPNCSGDDIQREINKAIDGIGSLSQYFNSIHANAVQSTKALHDNEEALREELLDRRLSGESD